MAYEIDFFELLFLAEACIPPRPIARSMFFERLCNTLFYQMTDRERAQMFNSLKDKIDASEESGRYFLSRFNPDNQYQVTATTGAVFLCCLHDEEYHTHQFKMLRKDVIVIIEKL